MQHLAAEKVKSMRRIDEQQQVGRIWNDGDVELLNKSATEVASSCTSGYVRE